MSECTPVDLDDLVARLADEDPAVRCLAAKELGRAGPAAAGAVDGLAGGLGDVDPIVRCMCASALGKVGPAAASAVGPLVDGLGDPVPAVRYWAAYALGRIGESTPEIQEALETVAADEAPTAAPSRTAARQALVRLRRANRGKA